MPRRDPDHFSKLANDLIADFRGLPNDEPRRQIKRPTQSAANIIEGIVGKYGIGQGSPEQSLRDRWAELVTPTLAAYSHVVEISKSGWLVVMVTNSVAKQELSNNRRVFLPKIKAVPGCGTIKGLTFRAG
ncbi:DUF721 domain-containing protein [Synoicihabitans lomoniglobus]|uniref:DUF721 domain-containing protein n=1 Tax=Synoicihabitans lomoniglobus TaxID=2909285 RepID=A0AAF0I2A2_9BACT|nr:DUF721 domain-containing protein [Opitutaceae bacterium LMO-M01]WED66372.1 DUF721 domain-containing protein [Opitutaceae bacterium LMO-M01]